MTGPISEWWDVDGTSLHSYALRITNLSGPYSGGVPMRGENMPVPYRPGSIWRAKVPAERVLTLGILVSAYAADGSGAIDPVDQTGANYRQLRRLLWRDGGAQYQLTKRWRLDNTILSATALAAYGSGFDADMSGQHRVQARVAVDLLLADPFFYAPSVTTAVAAGGGATVTNPGDASATGTGLTVTFNGPLTNPVLTNTANGLVLSLGAVIAGGDSIVLDLDAYTATRTSDSANMIGAVAHSGSRHWLALVPGANPLTLTASAGAGNAQVAMRAPYL
jgi:hypothetical protein